MSASRLLNRSFSLTRLRRASLLAWSVGTLAVAPATHAVVVPLVTINWGAGAFAVAGDSDVSTAGIFVSAFNFGGGNPDVTSTTINGVNFTAASLGWGTPLLEFGGYQLTAASGNGIYGSSYVAFYPENPAYSLSPNYQALIIDRAVVPESEGTLILTLSSLTVNNTYLFQWWNNSGGSVRASGDLTVDAGVSSLGKYALGTFTAVNASMKIEFSSSINAFQLRDVTAVPEPSTYAAILGLAGLGVAFLKRRMGQQG